MAKAMMGGEPRRRGIQSVEIGLRTLDALASFGTPVGLGLVAQASGLCPSQAHRYLVSLVATGMARQDPGSGRYELGPSAVRLGLTALAGTDPFKVADLAIEEFVAATGRTVQIAALGPLGPTVVRWHMGRPAVLTSFSVGTVLSLLHSATGRLFLALMPAAELEPTLTRELAALPDDRENAVGLLAEIRAEVAKTGRADVSGTIIPGLRATAFPILDLQGRVLFSVTALVPAQIVGDGYERDLDLLGNTCRTVSADLGWRSAAHI